MTGLQDAVAGIGRERVGSGRILLAVRGIVLMSLASVTLAMLLIATLAILGVFPDATTWVLAALVSGLVLAVTAVSTR